MLGAHGAAGSAPQRGDAAAEGEEHRLAARISCGRPIRSAALGLEDFNGRGAVGGDDEGGKGQAWHWEESEVGSGVGGVRGARREVMEEGEM